MAEKRVAIGIDLGTTYSCVGVYRNGRVEIIANDQGSRLTPSCVAFDETERHIGEAAKEQITVNPQNTVFNVKRLIGSKFNDQSVQMDINNGNFPFKVQEVDGNPSIEVTYKNETAQFAPEQISAMILTKMKVTADEFIGQNVTDAVITVPAYFNDSQRQATKDAGKIAGLNVLSIINEPTAAAIAYGLDRNDSKPKNILIFDLGGGTFDVVIMRIQNGTFDVKAVGGDTHLGGEDFDMRLVKHFISEFERKNKGITGIADDAKAVQRLKKACEKAKRSLSSSTKANIDVDCFFGQKDFHGSITAVRFNQLCSDLFTKAISIVESTLVDSKMQKSELDEIVLVGGSTRISKIRELLSEFFDGRTLNMSINPDEAVAYGAAVQAAVGTGDIPKKEVSLMDVAPLSLGIQTVGGVMNTIIERNTKVPIKKTKENFTTYSDNQRDLHIKVFEGENPQTKDNHLLGSFILSEIQNAPRGVPCIDVTFELDSNGILQVSAEDRVMKSNQTIVITSNKGLLTEETIARMVEESQELNEEDIRVKEVNDIRGQLEEYCSETKSTLQTKAKSLESSSSLNQEDVDNVIEIIDRTLEWLADNHSAGKEMLEQQRLELEQICIPVLAELQ